MNKNEYFSIFMAISLCSCTYNQQRSAEEPYQNNAIASFQMSQLKLNFHHSPPNANLYIDNLQLFSENLTRTPMKTNSRGQLATSTYLQSGPHEIKLVDNHQHKYLNKFISGKHESETLSCRGTYPMKCSLTSQVES